MFSQVGRDFGHMGLSAGRGHAIVTAHFDGTDMTAGVFGFTDPTNTGSTRRTFYTNAFPQGNAGSWEGYIRGTDAYAKFVATNSTQNFMVSVDDGAWFAAAITDVTDVAGETVAILFQGLTNIPHKVRIRAHASASGATWFLNSGNFVWAVGSSPAISSLVGPRWMITDPSFPGQHLSYLVTKPTGSTSPTFSDVSHGPSGILDTAAGSGTTIRFRAKASEIWVYTGEGKIRTSIDGATLSASTAVPFTADNSPFRYWRKVLSGLDATTDHYYTLVPGDLASDLAGYQAHASTLGVMVDGTFSTYTSIPTLIQYGDSVTFGSNYVPDTTDVVDIYQTGVHFGYAAAAAGERGITTTQLLAKLATYRAYRGVVENAAVIAIGVNGIVQADYVSIINALISAGVSKIICRGVIMGTGIDGVRGAIDTTIAAAVASVANPSVVYVPTDDWIGIVLNDSVHPTAAGYETMANYAIRDYAPYLGNDVTPPTVVSFNPVDNATGISTSTNLVLTFSEKISLGASGVITLKKTSDDSTIDSWDVSVDAGLGAGQLSVVEKTTLALFLTTSLTSSTEYYVIWDAGVVTDYALNNVAAQASKTLWSFTTAAGGAYLGLLDIYPTACMAYSFRKLRNAYAGSAVRIRRSSDNAQADIGFDGSGNFDTAAAAAHIGGGTGNIVTWYDQSGNGLNVTQATAGSQPTYSATGMNGHPTATFDGGDLLLKASVANTSLPLLTTTIMAMVQDTAGAGGTTGIYGWVGTEHTNVFMSETFLGTINFFVGTDGAGSIGSTTVAVPSGWYTSGHVYEVGRESYYNQFITVDGVELTRRTAKSGLPTTGTVSFAVGTNNSSAPHLLKGNLSELVIWAADLAANRPAARANVTAYWA